MISASHRIPPLLQSDGSFAISNVEKCELLNTYFASVFTNDDGSLPSFAPRVNADVLMAPITFSSDIVQDALLHLPSKCSKSPDGFPALFFKSIASAIAFPLSLLLMILLIVVSFLKHGRLPLYALSIKKAFILCHQTIAQYH